MSQILIVVARELCGYAYIYMHIYIYIFICICIYIYTHITYLCELYISVCVEHLNRCKTSTLLPNLQGAQAYCGYLCQRSYSTMGEATGDAQLCTCTFSAQYHSNRLSWEPAMDISNGCIFCTAFAIWRLLLYWLFGSLFEHFSPFQNAELRMDIFDLFPSPFAFSYTEISRITS